MVLPAQQDRRTLVGTARALAAQDYPGGVDVVVVDLGGNRDVQRAVQALREVSLVRLPVPDRRAALTAAVSGAGGDVVALLDSRCRPGAGWLRETVAVLRDVPGPCVVTGPVRVVPLEPARPTRVERWAATVRARTGDRGWYDVASNAVVRRADLDLADLDLAGADGRWPEARDRARWSGLVRPGARVVRAPGAVLHRAAPWTPREALALLVRARRRT
ncbi:glycosyltransferase [Kineococcus terrestris]|uniref:glycosyltransferase n=1 Tax=Kineococcus terrestris TaxID=2044856 RepID=UPI0034DB66F6